MTRLITHLLFGVTAHDPLTFFVVAGLLILNLGPPLGLGLWLKILALLDRGLLGGRGAVCWLDSLRLPGRRWARRGGGSLPRGGGRRRDRCSGRSTGHDDSESR